MVAMDDNGSGAPSRLARRLGTGDAVAIGLGSMIGAGVFAAFGPAARAAGDGLLVGLAVAALVAYCNATSSAQLAAMYPESGGTYVYGRRAPRPVLGLPGRVGVRDRQARELRGDGDHLRDYAAPSLTRPFAVGAVLALTAVNFRGVQQDRRPDEGDRRGGAGRRSRLRRRGRSGWAARADIGPSVSAGRRTTLHGVLQAAGLLFFAFAGYARIATLGEEVIEPARTIPRAIPIALGARADRLRRRGDQRRWPAAGAASIAASGAPLATAVGDGRLAALVPAVRVGARSRRWASCCR